MSNLKSLLAFFHKDNFLTSREILTFSYDQCYWELILSDDFLKGLIQPMPRVLLYFPVSLLLGCCKKDQWLSSIQYFFHILCLILSMPIFLCHWSSQFHTLHCPQHLWLTKSEIFFLDTSNLIKQLLYKERSNTWRSDRLHILEGMFPWNLFARRRKTINWWRWWPIHIGNVPWRLLSPTSSNCKFWQRIKDGISPEKLLLFKCRTAKDWKLSQQSESFPGR